MPCRQVSTYNGLTGSGKAGGGGYATEVECNQACREGACCEGTTCSVKPQCQCQGAGKTFKGVGTTCSSYVVPSGSSVSLTFSYTQTDWQALYASAGYPSCQTLNAISQLPDSEMTICLGQLSGQNVFSAMSAGSYSQFYGSSNGVDASVIFGGACGNSVFVTVLTNYRIPGRFLYPWSTQDGANNLNAMGWMTGNTFEQTYYLYQVFDSGDVAHNFQYGGPLLTSTSSSFPQDGTRQTFVANRTPQSITERYITKPDGTEFVYTGRAWTVTFRVSVLP